jgi:hypothetical protein
LILDQPTLELLDTALNSTNETVKEHLSTLLTITALTHGAPESDGPLKYVFKRLENLEKTVITLEKEIEMLKQYIYYNKIERGLIQKPPEDWYRGNFDPDYTNEIINQHINSLLDKR